MDIRELDEDEIEQVSGGLTFAQGLGMGSFALGVAGQVTRFVPGAQVLSAGLSVLGIGVGALAGAAAAAHV
jgi:hypothetical protein